MKLTLIQQLDLAMTIAVDAHKGTFDKGGYPYIFHPIAVAEKCTSIEAKIVALLHDVLEDCPKYTATRLQGKGISHHLITALIALTRKDTETYKDFIGRCRENELAKQVKLADLEHNMDPARMNNLSADKRAYLMKKYTKAKADLIYGA